MKARVIATGEIVEVMYSHTVQDKGYDIVWYITPQGPAFSKEELEFIDTGESLDYWTRLEHQYAGMAMQGILSNPHIAFKDITVETVTDVCVDNIIKIAHDLVEKYRKEK